MCIRDRPTLVHVLRKDITRQRWKSVVELSLLCNTGDRIFGGSALNVSTDHADLTHLYYMQDTSTMLTRWAITLQGFDFTVEQKLVKLHVVPDTLSRLFGDTPEDTTQAKKSLSEVLLSQSKLASICRNAHEDGQLYRSPSPRAYEEHSDNLNELSLVESDRELFASIA